MPRALYVSSIHNKHCRCAVLSQMFVSHLFAFLGFLLADLTGGHIQDGSQKTLMQNSTKPLVSTLRGVNLGGWLVLEVRPNAIFYFEVPLMTLISHGSPHRSSTIQVIQGLLMNGRSVNSRTAQRPLIFCKTTGVPGLPRQTLLLSLLRGMLHFFSVLYIDDGIASPMSDCQSVIGHSIYQAVNLLFKDKSPTFGKQSSGLKLMVSRLLLICTVFVRCIQISAALFNSPTVGAPGSQNGFVQTC